jgi:S1-C subfamily serine protease
MNKQSLYSGVLGGLVVAVVVAILLATGVIDTGDDAPAPRPAISQTIPDRPASDEDGGDTTGKSVSEIYDQDGPGVAFIQSQTGSSGSGSEATGSGFVMDKQGYIVTNAHVVEGSNRVQVSFDDNSGDLIDAKVVGADPSTDIALIKIEPKDTKLRPLSLGDSEKARVGDPVVAIGNPFGYSRTVTTGIVSAKQRRIEAPNGFQIDNVIQTDAAINPGNSGGPLLDANGRVLGINSQIATGGSRGSVGIGFAVPVNTVKSVVPQLKSGGKIDRAYLGITSARLTQQIADDLKLPTDNGALVQEVVPGGPADKAGVRGGAGGSRTQIARGGDLITEIDGRKVESPDDVAAAIEDNKPGDKVTVKFLRDGKARSAVVTLGKRPAQVPGQGSGSGGGGILPQP